MSVFFFEILTSINMTCPDEHAAGFLSGVSPLHAIQVVGWCQQTAAPLAKDWKQVMVSESG